MSEKIRLELDFRSKKPISDQVQQEMRRLIQEGYLQPGDQLPTVRKLAAQLRVNFNTIARAYRTLDQEGLITTRQGRGSYIPEETKIESQIVSQDSALQKQAKIERIMDAFLDRADHLGISPMELYDTLAQRILKIDQQKPRPRLRRIRIEQKRRRYSPKLYQEWLDNETWGNPRRKQKKIVSRETNGVRN